MTTVTAGAPKTRSENKVIPKVNVRAEFFIKHLNKPSLKAGRSTTRNRRHGEPLREFTNDIRSGRPKSIRPLIIIVANHPLSGSY